MTIAKEPFLWRLLEAVAASEPHPLYPARFSRQANIDRDMLDDGLDELRRRGLVELTEWVRDFGQGCALTDTGRQAIVLKTLPPRVVSSPAVESRMEAGAAAYERAEIVRAAFLQPSPPYVSRLLLAANVFYFLAGAFFAWSNDLSVKDYLEGRSQTTAVVLAELGGLNLELVFRHEPPEYRRIFLSGFLHVGLIHIGMNMYFLYTLGPLLEALWGSIRFLAIYLVAGVVSGCVVLIVEIWQQKNILTVGASGSLFGIFASFLVWFLFNKKYLPRDFARAWSKNISLNLILLTAINFVDGISWQGHLGGAIGGLLAAIALHVERFSPHVMVRVLAVVALAAIPAMFFGFLLWQVGRI